MKIPEFGTLQMVRTDARHYGTGDVVSLTSLSQNKDSTTLLHTTQKDGTLSFKDYLFNTFFNNIWSIVYKVTLPITSLKPFTILSQ